MVSTHSTRIIVPQKEQKEQKLKTGNFLPFLRDERITSHSDISECFEKNSKHLIVHEEIRDVVAKNAPFNFTGRKSL